MIVYCRGKSSGLLVHVKKRAITTRKNTTKNEAVLFRVIQRVVQSQNAFEVREKDLEFVGISV
jgi:hypothetical protein